MKASIMYRGRSALARRPASRGRVRAPGFRSLFFALLLAPQPPDVLLPRSGSSRVDPDDLHIVTAPFEGSVFAPHRATEVEIIEDAEVVWRASVGPVTHLHPGDGAFVNALAGAPALPHGRSFLIRARHQDEDRAWSEWGELAKFRTRVTTAPRATLVKSIFAIDADAWRTAAGEAVALTAENGGVVRLETKFGPLAELRPNGVVRFNTNSESAPIRVRVSAIDSLAAPASRIRFLSGDAGGEIREINVNLPALSFPSGGACSFWVDQDGSAWTALESDVEPVWAERVGAAPLPWRVAPGFRVERVATDVSLPVNIAFVSNPSREADAPLAYISKFHEGIAVLRRDGVVRSLVHSLLNFVPDPEEFPGKAENGIIGIAVDPANENLYITHVYYSGANPFNRVVRYTLEDGGRAVGDSTIILTGIRSWPNHQIEFVTFGPDGKLYIGVGDGFIDPGVAQDPNDLRGKVLRINPDGSIPADNPDPASRVFARGLRNPFGAAFRPGTGTLFVSDNGTNTNDRIVRVFAGDNMGWPTDPTRGAIYLWERTVAPTAIAFAPPDLFPGREGRLYAALSGSTYRQGTTDRGKSIVEFTLDSQGAVVDTATILTYTGDGFGSTIGLAFGPDGLYWTDLYGEAGFDSAGTTGGVIYKIVPDSAPLSPPCASERLGSAAAIRLARNPGVGAVRFRLDLEGAEEFEATLYDASGRRLSELPRARFGPGVIEVDVGRDLPAGVYFYRARVGGASASGKALLVR
ncbi:MAG: PQQ-dependent sugar dehydrogenase [bacterium]